MQWGGAIPFARIGAVCGFADSNVEILGNINCAFFNFKDKDVISITWISCCLGGDLTTVDDYAFKGGYTSGNSYFRNAFKFV